jgi:hypothetical protein
MKPINEIQCHLEFALVVIVIGLGQRTYAIPPPEGANSSAVHIEAKPWPEADALFRKDPRWQGADDAYSVDLGSKRVLWLFADSFIARGDSNTRRGATMVRNSLAIQHGYDPSSASIKFYWGGQDDTPTSFFQETPDVWYWPGHGIRINDLLLIFLMQVRKIDTGLGFEVFGWTAIAVDNPDEKPNNWKVRWLHSPENSFGVVVGSASILRIEDYIYAFSAKEPGGTHDVYLVRWPVSKAVKGDLSEPCWWNGEKEGWIAQRQLKQRPTVVFSGGQTEFTVHFETKLRRFLQVQTVGFGVADVSARWAEKLTGPWSDLQPFYRPNESNQGGVFVYAGKSHPELIGADLVLTYVVNNSDFGKLVNDASIYYPRFLKATLAR